MSFQIHGLTAAPFAPLFALSDEALKSRHITRTHSDAAQGFPCRISLAEAPEQAEVLLLNYTHLTLASPYRATHAIYVSKDAVEPRLDEGEIPQSLMLRPLSLRAFAADGNMCVADLADQETLSGQLSEMLTDKDIAFVHVHNAKQGCYAALATRPGEFDPRWRGHQA